MFHITIVICFLIGYIGRCRGTYALVPTFNRFDSYLLH